MESEIYTEASPKQLGSVITITQGNRPLAFFSRKLSTMQQKYSVTELELLAIVETLKEFKGMLWGQRLKVYTDHKNLIQDALGLTSDRVYQWRLLLKEFGPEIVYIKGTHNTVAGVISSLDIGPILSEHENWMTFTKCWCHYTMQEESAIDTSAYQEEMNLVFANRSEEDVIYPLTVRESAEAQKLDASLKTLKDQYSTQLVESRQLLCKDGKMVIPKELQHLSWYHHYLQHPGHTRLEETLCAAMYWKGMQNTVHKYVKNCHACQVNKRHKHKYGKLPTKFAITNPWDVLCVDLIGPYTIKDVVLAFPDFSNEFEIYTDALSKQLGSVITQGNRPLAFFSRKLSVTQQKYSVTEIELLAIVETLNEFKGILWGQNIKVYTDHKNLIQDALGLTSDRVYRWRLLLEEYGPEIGTSKASITLLLMPSLG
eukprot:CCRYP_012721-RA/>CCRYP_012721-RA protein AED:0.31 eAED:0.45 QI:0/0/0/1/0/0/3/0/427